ncbi:hypothetical protein BDZ89DRAFT_1061346 [Hymenopellis radicata]|nr:hypothetical protein BDZ89DRAFT_1061346 [Hymenopellis radicata]
MPYSTPSTSRTTASLYQANLFDIFTGRHKYPSRSPIESQDRLSDIDSEDERPSNLPTPPRPLLVVDTDRHSLSSQSQSPSSVNQTSKVCAPNAAHPSPTVLSNGKPLKSSFKRRLSFPPIPSPSLERPGVHRRRTSDPSPQPFEREESQTTAPPKTVHFESKLETVCFFRESAEASALLARNTSPPPPPTSFLIPLRYVINTAESDPIPSPAFSPSQEVIIEDVHMEELTMKGSVIIRNIAYEKAVAVLFTIDDWQTRSEVVGHYSASLSSLPSSITSESSVAGEWDRFNFSIHLDHQTLTLASRTMYVTARFSAAGGEWWDNNRGNNYCIHFSQVSDLLPTPALPLKTDATLECQLNSFSKDMHRKKCGEAKTAEPHPYSAYQVKWTPYTASLIPLSYSSDDSDDDDSSPVTPECAIISTHDIGYPRASAPTQDKYSPSFGLSSGSSLIDCNFV